MKWAAVHRGRGGRSQAAEVRLRPTWHKFADAARLLRRLAEPPAGRRKNRLRPGEVGAAHEVESGSDGGEQMLGERSGIGRMLPVARINGVAYFLDVRLHQLRAVDNPQDWVDFE